MKSLRSAAVTAVKRTLARRGLALVRLEDEAVCHWVADEVNVIPLPTTPIRDEVACLRPLRLTDAAAVSAGADDPDIVNFAIWANPFTEEHARRWILKSEVGRQAGQYFALALLDARTDEFAGVLGVNLIDHQALTAEQFLWLIPSARRKGLANHATLLLDRWIFENTPISRMVAVALVENEPARRQLPTIGYTEEGILRGGAVHHGERHDSVQFSLLRSDLEARDAAAAEEAAGAHASPA
jgi:RimJ/RimL family protein N-acetyltransferase